MTTGDQSPIPDYLSMLRLDGRNYVVAGAGVGMGRHSTHALAQAGAAKIICVDVDAGRADEIADEVGRDVAIPWAGDVTKREGAAALGAFAEQELGKIDGFVDIIGMAKWESILDMTDETFDWEIDINLRHAFLLSQELGRRMVTTGGGTMTFIASVSGLTSGPMHAAYGAAKAGLQNLTGSMAAAWTRKGVRVNCIACGAVRTPGLEADVKRMGIEIDVIGQTNGSGRIAEPDEIGYGVLFFASDASSYCSGQTLYMHGGPGPAGV